MARAVTFITLTYIFSISTLLYQWNELEKFIIKQKKKKRKTTTNMIKDKRGRS